MITRAQIENTIRQYSLELIELANREHSIDEFNKLYYCLQWFKELADTMHEDKCA